MASENTAARKKGAVESFKETAESLVIAFILAFVFRAFVAEAFVIPTGSMADTLAGAHFRLTCIRCAYQYDYGFVPERYGLNRGVFPGVPMQLGGGSLRGKPPICPMCGTEGDMRRRHRVSNGDRIFVFKYLYQFRDPERWDVVVFKNPIEPDINFIKRLVARPHETIEIMDGDIYIDGLIQAKPKHVQEALWLKIFDNDYQPLKAPQQRLWQQPFTAVNEKTAWQIDQRRHRFEFGGAGVEDALTFDAERLRLMIQNFSAYNGPSTDYRSVGSDLKLSFQLAAESNEGRAIIRLGKYGRVYAGQVGFDGTCRIIKAQSGVVLMEEKFASLEAGRPINVSLAIVDHRIELIVGENRLRYEGANLPEDWGYDRSKQRLEQMPSVGLAGEGCGFTLTHIRLHRDTHYSNLNVATGGPGLATEGYPFELRDDEFFVLGDNSPASHDSRFWEEPGNSNGQAVYRQGIVPRDYLIGRALFVYWPGGYHISPKVRFGIIPNVGEMRFIY